jgi:hypothetical protein
VVEPLPVRPWALLVEILEISPFRPSAVDFFQDFITRRLALVSPLQVSIACRVFSTEISRTAWSRLSSSLFWTGLGRSLSSGRCTGDINNEKPRSSTTSNTLISFHPLDLFPQLEDS